ncbi:response regulator transcription factor [Vibrio sp. ArtGut-C1]|uniref:response regulator transcription factor n=1 Tax=Vibrio sp. ArtGut-C1 TaxID=2259137 RepID=UPI000A18C1FF|nr:response regulator transcription factor [Vibrio sp. ArtGut-C1]
MEKLSTIKAILIAEDNINSCMFKDFIEKNHNIKVFFLSTEALINEEFFLPLDCASILFIDYNTIFEEKIVTEYKKIRKSSLKNIKEVIYNYNGNSSEELFKWEKLCGIFYNNDTANEINTGIIKIISDEMWFTRAFANDYIEYLQSKDEIKKPEEIVNLTKRELQILNFICLGLSNRDISSRLFIKENTIKSHIHNIFKKVNVKNRVQSIIWAKNNKLFKIE